MQIGTPTVVLTTLSTAFPSCLLSEAGYGQTVDVTDAEGKEEGVRGSDSSMGTKILCLM